MSKPTDIRLTDIRTETERIAYRAPIKFGGRVVTDAVLVNIWIEVETRDGRRGGGFGSMPMGNVWAWPSNTVSTAQSLEAMLAFVESSAAAARNYREFGHPLDITRDLAEQYATISGEIQKKMGLAEPMPKLAELVSASPLEAAIHDAYGKTLKANSYNLLGREYVHHDLAHYLTNSFAGEYLDRYTLREPKAKMPLYHLVGALDPLVDSDINQRLNDSLPETLSEWIVMDGQGKRLIKDNFRFINEVDQEMFIAAKGENEYGVSTWEGGEIIPFKYRAIRKMGENFAVQDKDYGWEVRTRENKNLSRDKFFELSPVANNMFIGKTNGKYGVMDSTGMLKLPFVYDQFKSLSHPLYGFSMMKKGKWYLFDKMGNHIGYDKFNLNVKSYSNYGYVVTENDKDGFIDLLGYDQPLYVIFQNKILSRPVTFRFCFLFLGLLFVQG